MKPATDSAELTLQPSGASLALTQDPVTKSIAAMIDKGVTADNVAAFDKLLDVYERLQTKDAERQFTSAFVRLQSQLPVIVASTVIPNRGKYERFEDVMRQISEPLRANGFTVSFSMDFKDSRVIETCTLRHIAGHSQSNSFAVRTGRADSDTQADCKAATTAKRNALLNCLNIVIRQDAYQNEDSDASLEGAFITPDKAQYIKELLAETKSDVPAFLRFAGADKIEEIGSARYDEVVAALHKKAKR